MLQFYDFAVKSEDFNSSTELKFSAVAFFAFLHNTF